MVQQVSNKMPAAPASATVKPATTRVPQATGGPKPLIEFHNLPGMITQRPRVAVEAPGSDLWRKLVIGAISVVVLVSAMLVYILTRPPAPRPNATEDVPPVVVPEGEVMVDDLLEGDLVALTGEVPWGENHVHLDEQRQGFIVKTSDNKVWWVVDSEGVWSRHALVGRTREDEQGIPFYIEVRGKLVRNPPLAPPSGTQPVWTLVLSERWTRRPRVATGTYHVLIERRAR
jgi:hypothetical protein